MEVIIQALEAEKTKIQEQLDRIDQMIALAGGGEERGARGVGRPKGAIGRKVKGGRGALKDAIIVEIQAAGINGIAVKDVAAKVGLPPSRLGTWFATTGKKVKEIKRLGRGIYSWKGSSPAPVESLKVKTNGKKRRSRLAV